MKVKFLCILLAAVCCFSACQKPEDPGQTGDVQKEEKAETSEKEQVEEEELKASALNNLVVEELAKKCIQKADGK